MNLPADVYYRVVNIAESYYVLRNRLKKMESSVLFKTVPKDGQPRGNQVADTTAHKAEQIVERQEECQRKVNAIERALNPLGPIYKDFIRRNLFEHKDMKYIDLPLSLPEKDDVRTFFLNRLARYLHEI